MAFISPLGRDGSGGAIWSAQIEAALAGIVELEVLRLVDCAPRRGALGSMVRRARTYGLERSGIIRPWVLRQLGRGVAHFIVDSTCLGWLAKDIRRVMPPARITVIAHNVEAQYLRRRDDLHACTACLLQLLVARGERIAAQYADQVLFLTRYDQRLFRRLYHPIADSSVVPIAIDGGISSPGPSPVAGPLPRLVFVGSDYFANRHALRLLSQSLPASANLEIVVAGRVGAPPNPAPQLRFVGYVADIESLYASCTAAIVPVTIGGGMKVKIAEALSYGLPVIASVQSSRGYEAAIAAGVLRVFRNAGQLVSLASAWHVDPPDQGAVRRVFDAFYSARQLADALRRVTAT